MTDPHLSLPGPVSRTDPPLLRVENIRLTRGKPILKDVSFDLHEGEMLIVLGPSGAGKSSLLRCLNRLELIDGGGIYLEGRETRTLKSEDLRRRIGLLFQIPHLPPLTVKENIRLGPSLNGHPLEEEECRNLLEAVGLDPGFFDRNVEALSAGERQRVALAQVLANRPQVLLMDEPTSALDPTAVTKIETLIRTIHRERGITTLLITHDIGQAHRFNAHTLVLIDGEIRSRGNIRDLMNIRDDGLIHRFFSGNL